MTTVSPTLANLGYTGATGSTPYMPYTTQQVDALKAQYGGALNGASVNRAPSNAIQLNINFDGTQNNREYPDSKNNEVMTNIGQLAYLQAGTQDPDRFKNTIYMSGIGAQTALSGAKDANGNPLPGSSPSNFESTPEKAGDIGNQILEDAYLKLVTRVAEIQGIRGQAQIKHKLNKLKRAF